MAEGSAACAHYGNTAFGLKKDAIVASLSVPESSYTDASPKGSVDVGIRGLVDQINSMSELVTTSSCAGRIAVFLEGEKSKSRNGGRMTTGTSGEGLEGTSNESHSRHILDEHQKDAFSQTGKSTLRKKAAGGRWLFVSHSPVVFDALTGNLTKDTPSTFSELFGMRSPQHPWHWTKISQQAPLNEQSTQTNCPPSEQRRFIHFKFEPMVRNVLSMSSKLEFKNPILHIRASSLDAASNLLTAAQAAGFRESGATGLLSPAPMVAIRTSALAQDCVIGYLQQGETGSLPAEVTGANVKDACQSSSDELLLPLVSEDYLKTLAAISTQRFSANNDRMQRLAEEIAKVFGNNRARATALPEHPLWEDWQARKERKRREGLARKEALQAERGVLQSGEPDGRERSNDILAHGLDH